MVAINFKPQFADDVESGKKRQTIRERARCKLGDSLQLYTGMNTKACRKLKDAICASVTPIEIDHCNIYLNGHAIENQDKIVQEDGFPEYTDMAIFFEKQYGCLPFKGVLIKWDAALSGENK